VQHPVGLSFYIHKGQCPQFGAHTIRTVFCLLFQQGRTPLHAACEKGHADVVEFLLRHDADLDARDEDGNCPLHTATENQQTQVVQLLLDNGNQPDPENTVSKATIPGREVMAC